MKDKFQNPWAKGGEHYPTEVLSNAAMSNDSDSESDSESDMNSISKSLTNFGSNGFTNIKLTDGRIVSIPIYFKVNNLKYNSDKSREEFLLMEWPFINKFGSVKCEKIGLSRFGSVSYESPAKIYFNKTSGELKLGNGAVLSAYSSASDPIPNGTHKIWLPDYPHPYGYNSYSKNADIWFRLGNEGSHRYLHLGSVSLGCVSVGKSSASDTTEEFSAWDLVYSHICKKRSGNKHIGELIVS